MRWLKSLLARIEPWQYWLFAITAVAIGMRLIPSFINNVWGVDFGIYYGITQTMLETGDFLNPYYGWGSSYSQFPILYMITAGVHIVTGIEVLQIMPHLIPIFGGLCVFVFYFIAYELTGDRLKSLLAAGILAVIPLHVYQTTHVAPLTLGHFFFVLSLYFFLRARKNVRFTIPLMISTVLLIMTHHLTTYMYIVSLLFILVTENASSREWRSTVRFDLAYFVFASGAMFLYWRFFATVVYDGFMMSGLGIGEMGATVTVGLFYLGVAALFCAVAIKRRLGLFWNGILVSVEWGRWLFWATMAILSAIIITFSFISIPWEETPFVLDIATIGWAIPLMVAISFAVAGFGMTRTMKNGAFVRGWLIGLTLSLIATTLLGSAMEYHRHFEYLMVPASIVAVYGVKLVLGEYEQVISKKLRKYGTSSRLVMSRDLAYILVVVLLIVGNGGSTYPTFQSAMTYNEDFTQDNLEAVLWLADNVSVNGTTIASDHRIERMVEAFGFNTTYNNITGFWDSMSNEALLAHDISYVIVDSYMVDPLCGVFSIPYHYHMTNESRDKFSEPPFVLIHRNESVINPGGGVHWTQIYRVEWWLLDIQGNSGFTIDDMNKY